ncbi:TPA: hypothetical protein ON570_002111 [Citrobacter werkmanii]|nr:hypothetical protein [Citrobacter werkmanii]
MNELMSYWRRELAHWIHQHPISLLRLMVIWAVAFVGGSLLLIAVIVSG